MTAEHHEAYLQKRRLADDPMANFVDPEDAVDYDSSSDEHRESEPKKHRQPSSSGSDDSERKAKRSKKSKKSDKSHKKSSKSSKKHKKK